MKFTFNEYREGRSEVEGELQKKTIEGELRVLKEKTLSGFTLNEMSHNQCYSESRQPCVFPEIDHQPKNFRVATKDSQP